MATFGKRVQPKHRATPGDRSRVTSTSPRAGAHAATVSAPVDPAPVYPAPVDPSQVEFTQAPVDLVPVAPEPPSAPPAPAPELAAPLSRELPAAAVSVSEPERPTTDPGTMRVLVVDDNEDVRGLLRIAFARADIDVVGAASDSREALAMAQHDRPGIILLDVNLPDMAGLDLIPQLRERCPQARIVMFSAQCSPQVTETARQRGAMGFVEKGVSMKTVIAHLHEVANATEGQVVEPFPLTVYR